MSNVNYDVQITKYLKDIDVKELEIQELERNGKKWKTSGQYPKNDGTIVRIKTASFDEIISTISEILDTDEHNKKILNFIGEEYKDEFESNSKFQIYSKEDFLDDLKLALKLKKIRKKKEDLAKLKERLKKLYSEDHKKESEFSDIVSNLTKHLD